METLLIKSRSKKTSQLLMDLSKEMGMKFKKIEICWWNISPQATLNYSDGYLSIINNNNWDIRTLLMTLEPGYTPTKMSCSSSANK